MRRFVVIGQTAASGPGFSMKDIGGTGGRLDVLIRCVPAALLVSHGIRRDAEIYTVHGGPPSPPKTLHFSGETIRHLNPDERSTAHLVEKALSAFTTGPIFQPVTPGVRAAAIGVQELLDALPAGPLVVLDEAGDDIASAHIPEDATFVVGDHEGFTPADAQALSARGARRVSLGPVSLQADQCIVVLHHHLDRRRMP